MESGATRECRTFRVYSFRVADEMKKDNEKKKRILDCGWKVIGSVGRFFEFWRTFCSGSLNIAGWERENQCFWLFGETHSETKNRQLRLFQKPWKNWHNFHERTGKEPVFLSGWFFDFFMFWEPWFVCQYPGYLNILRTKKVSEYIPGLITSGYLSLILRTTPTLVICFMLFMECLISPGMYKCCWKENYGHCSIYMRWCLWDVFLEFECKTYWLLVGPISFLDNSWHKLLCWGCVCCPNVMNIINCCDSLKLKFHWRIYS